MASILSRPQCVNLSGAEVPIMMTSLSGNVFRATGHLCGEFTGPGEFPAQRPVTRSFDAFFDLRLNKRLSKQSDDLRRYRAHYNVIVMITVKQDRHQDCWCRSFLRRQDISSRDANYVRWYVTVFITNESQQPVTFQCRGMKNRYKCKMIFPQQNSTCNGLIKIHTKMRKLHNKRIYGVYQHCSPRPLNMREKHNIFISSLYINRHHHSTIQSGKRDICK